MRFIPGKKASEDIVDAVERKPGHFHIVGQSSLPRAEHLDHIGSGGCTSLRNMAPFSEDEKYLHAQHDAGSMSCDG
jgi:hypothetical protein